jgi:uncharacterized protein
MVGGLCFDISSPVVTWFPLIDRNPQTFVRNIFEAKEADFRSATHRIHRSAAYPSHVSLPIVVGTAR